MTTTAPTVHLEGIGHVPALPEHLHPVAAAGRPIPVGAYGIVVWTTERPELVATGIIGQVAAMHAAGLTRAARVYVVRRCTAGITVHAPDMAHCGHLLGSVPFDCSTPAAPAGDKAARAWRNTVAFVPATKAEAGQHATNICEALRRVHGLPASATPTDILLATIGSPRPAAEYLDAYCHLIGDRTAMHEYTENHRTHRTHR